MSRRLAVKPCVVLMLFCKDRTSGQPKTVEELRENLLNQVRKDNKAIADANAKVGETLDDVFSSLPVQVAELEREMNDHSARMQNGNGPSAREQAEKYAQVSGAE